MRKHKRPAYSSRRKHDRTKVIYGVCIHNKGIRHYCFNRDYKVLPVDLPDWAVEKIKNSAELINDEGTWCEGGSMPVEHGQLKDWKTYYVFTSKTTPKGV